MQRNSPEMIARLEAVAEKHIARALERGVPLNEIVITVMSATPLGDPNGSLFGQTSVKELEAHMPDVAAGIRHYEEHNTTDVGDVFLVSIYREGIGIDKIRYVPRSAVLS